MRHQTLPAVGQAGGTKPRQAVRYTPNVTPLIDVMFLLLLFFLLTTKFRVEEGAIPGTLPQTDGISGPTLHESPPNLNVYVYPVGAGNESAFYEVGGLSSRIMGPDDLYARLDALALGQAERDEMAVVIRPRGDARWGFVLEAYNQTARARFKTIAFAHADR